MNISGSHLSKEFFDLVKAIGESRSKQEEDRIIVNEVATLKSRVNEPSVSPRKMKEYLIRAVYVEMLGHDASFSYIHAVKFTHEKNLLCKRMGYLACNLCLHRDHELMLLLINTIQRDLNSANHLEVCAALTCVCRLVNQEMIPAIFPIVKNLLSHRNEVVRKKACIALHKLYKIQPDIIIEARDYVRRALCDPDPSVMGSSLHIIHELAKANPRSCKDLVPSLVSVLKQICEHRLPREYDYHRIPAPWLQIKLLSLLATLGAADQKACEQMYEVLQEVMRRADVGVNVAYAIISECVKTITAIYPSHQLLELAASSISRFISAENHNLKYVGVTGLASIVQVNAAYAATHQLVVVDCLEDPDDTLKRKTLDLLYRMTNPQNVTVIVDKFLFHLRTSVDQHLRRDLTFKVTQLAERYAPDNHWYIDTMNSVFEIAGNLVEADTAYNLIQLIAEGPNGDEALDMEFRRYAVDTYVRLCENMQNVPDILVRIIAWVLGEYGGLTTVEGYTVKDVIDLLCDRIDRTFEDPLTRGWVITAVTKLCGMNGITKNTSVDEVINRYKKSQYTDLQQRCNELRLLLQMPNTMKETLPYDAFSEDIRVDQNLSFLDSYVNKALAAGASPYVPPERRKKPSVVPGISASQEVHGAHSSLNFTPYEAPAKHPVISEGLSLSPHLQNQHSPTLGTTQPNGGIGGGGGSSQLNTAGSPSTKPSQTSPTIGFQVQGPRHWGPSGYNKNTSTASNTGGVPQKDGSVTGSPLSTPGYPPYPSSSPSSSHSTLSNATATTAASTVHQELTEREKTAFALFSGIGASKAPTAAPTSYISPSPLSSRLQRPSGHHEASRKTFASVTTNVTSTNTDAINNEVPPHNSSITLPPAAAETTAGEKANSNGGGGLDLLDFDYQPQKASEGGGGGGGGGVYNVESNNVINGGPAVTKHTEKNGHSTRVTSHEELLLLDLNTDDATATNLKTKSDCVIEPLNQDINEVGSQWGSLTFERRLDLRDPHCSSCDAFMAKLQDVLRIHVVQVIGSEGIAAARVKNIPGSVIYIHCKVDSPSIELLAKTSHERALEAVLDVCHREFTAK